MSTGLDNAGRLDYGGHGPAAASATQASHTQSGGSSFKGFGLGCLVAVLAGSAVLGLIALVLVVLVFSSAVGSAGFAGFQSDGLTLVESTVSGSPGQPKVAMVPIQGVLMPYGRAGAGPARVLKAMLAKAKSDPSVDGLILMVDSPGGGITTCDIMHKAIVDYRRETGEPVVVLMRHMAASGGYYVSCPADYIIAHPTTITGSIGVIMPMYDFSLLMRTLGVANRTVKSGEFKDMGSMFAEKSAEQRKDEKRVLEEIVNEMHERFVQIVADGRAMDIEVARKLSDGRIYTAQQAEANGLIDETGYEETAIAKAEEMIGAGQAHVVRYARLRSFTEAMLGSAREPTMTEQIERLLGMQGGAPLMYLWTPPVPDES